MRTAVKCFVERGGPVYAECGGLMYLAQSLTGSGGTWDMAGAISGRIEMTERPVGRGYVVLRETGHGLWPPEDGGASRDIPAHEFHYSRYSWAPSSPPSPADDARFAYQVKRGTGISGRPDGPRFDGLIHRNVLANYAHFRNTAANPWVKRFTGFVRAHKAAEAG